MKINDSLQYICCPSCKSDLFLKDDQLICSSCDATYSVLEGDILSIVPNMTDDLMLSIEKWDELYRNQLARNELENNFKYYENRFKDDVVNQLIEAKALSSDTVYLEIGCGTFFLGQSLAKDVGLIIGIDFSPTALKIAKKMLDGKGISNYILIHGDIQKMPLKNDAVDLIYGGGVIEHFENTSTAVCELYRVLKQQGVSVNTVPHLNLGSLTYRQIWGNIPNFPILKQLAELIHIKLLGGKHMMFGYEFSFLPSTIKKIHINCGFTKVDVDKFKVKTDLEFVPKSLRGYADYLCTNSKLFWPMIKVTAQK